MYGSCAESLRHGVTPSPRRTSMALRVLGLALLLIRNVGASRVLTQDAPAAATGAGEHSPLLSLVEACSNWAEATASAAGFIGWDNTSEPCGVPGWTGLECTAGAVTAL